MSPLVIVDYGLGNLFSVQKAFEALGERATISSDPDVVASAERIVLPGIGAFGDGMATLRAKGLDQALEQVVRKNGKPFLGICLGLQFLADVGEEYGSHTGLGWIPGHVRKIDVGSQGLKIPHIGWNDLVRKGDSPLFRGIPASADFYFVHSFQLVCNEDSDILATTTYGETITAAVQRDNIFATQFHPEKSQEHGQKLLENFLAWKP